MKGLNTKINTLHANTIIAKHVRVQVSSVLLSDLTTSWGKVHSGTHLLVYLLEVPLE